jgi:hypothetical protein
MPDTPDDIEYGRTSAWERIAREEEHPRGPGREHDKTRRRGLAGHVGRLVRPIADRVRRSG